MRPAKQRKAGSAAADLLCGSKGMPGEDFAGIRDMIPALPDEDLMPGMSAVENG